MTTHDIWPPVQMSQPLNEFVVIIRDVKSPSRPRGQKNWPRPRDYWPRPHDSCGLGQLTLVAS